MKVDEIRKAMKKEPFQPFALRMGSGEIIAVKHPEFMMITPSGRSVVVALDESSTPEGTEYTEILDTMLIEAIIYGYTSNGSSNGDAA